MTDNRFTSHSMASRTRIRTAPASLHARRSRSGKRPVVLVTGASQGIGAAIALRFAQDIPGVRLALVSRNARKLIAVAKRCRAAGAGAEVFPADVTDEGQVKTLRADVVKAFGRVDVLIGNAGAFRPASFLDATLEAFDDMIAVNLRSQFLVARAFVPQMVKRRTGDVFLMGSVAGIQAYPSSAAYCIAKFGVTGLARVMRAELRSHGVRVCLVVPGATATPSWEGSGVKPERMMPAEDIASAVCDVYRLSRRSAVEELILRPQQGDL